MTEVIKNKNMKWWVGVATFIVFFGIILFFSYEKMCFIWKGVKLEATMENSPNSSIVTIHGNAKRATRLTINGRDIFIDKEGNFYEYVSPLPGFYVIEIKAVDRFGKVKEKEFKIVKENNAEAIAFDNNSNIKN